MWEDDARARTVATPSSHERYEQPSVCSLRTVHTRSWPRHPLYHTFNALMDLPLAIASHSPGAVEWPVFIVIPGICGDHARFVTSLLAEYAMIGSVTILFFTSGRGEFSREFAVRGEVAVCV